MKDANTASDASSTVHDTLQRGDSPCIGADASPAGLPEHGDEPETNFTAHTPFVEVARQRYSRREMMRGGLQAAVAGLFVAANNSALAAPGFLPPAAGGRPPFGLGGDIGFSPVPIYNGDEVLVAPGYTARPILVLGEPIIGTDVGNPDANTVSAFEHCTGAEMEQRIGSHHDGMHYFPFPSDPNNHGIICLNHEYIDARKMFPENEWVSSGIRPADQVRKGVAAHGVSVVEVRRHGGSGEWTVQASPLNRRITAETPMALSGPVRGSALVRTKYSPDGTMTRGTLNNCAHGYTPWHTYLTCEENWASYFAAGTQASRREFRRYGVGPFSNRYGWDMADGQPTESPSNPEPYRRFNAEATGLDATGDYRNEPNGQGWIVEIDPWDPDSTPIKRTAMGRFAHEGCVFAPAQQGQPMVFYSGDDAVNQYIYKFVTAERYHRNRADGGMLDRGTLYAARFSDDGSGEWLALDLADARFRAAVERARENPRLVWPGGQFDDFDGFRDQADVLVNTRLAADVAGATPMDRPEWGAVHPQTNEVYFTLTNNGVRGVDSLTSTRPVPGEVDAANPRPQSSFGHVIRWREQGNRPWALRFEWDIFVLCGPTDDSRDLNGDALDPDNVHASPDGLWIDHHGVLWIQTDMGSGQQEAEFNRLGNNQMLAANPYTGEIRRFFVGCRGQEVTGVVTTPDSRTMFINLQHPGESSESRPTLASSYPDGPGSGGRGRSCTIVITKNDDGVIGS